MAKYSEYTSDTHQSLVQTLREVTDNILSEGVSETTYAFGEKVPVHGIIARIKSNNAGFDPQIIDEVFQATHNPGEALETLASMGLKVADRGIKHFAKDSALDAIERLIDPIVKNYNVPPSIRVQLGKFKDAFRVWGEGKATTTSQQDHGKYFDDTVIGFRQNVDSIIETISKAFKVGPKLTAEKSDGGVKENVGKIIVAIHKQAQAVINDPTKLASFMSGFLDAVQKNTVAAFLNDPETKVLLGGQVKATVLIRDLDEKGQNLRGLLTHHSSKHVANIAIKEVQEKYNRVFASLLTQ